LWQAWQQWHLASCYAYLVVHMVTAAAAAAGPTSDGADAWDVAVAATLNGDAWWVVLGQKGQQIGYGRKNSRLHRSL
jgi:hypothetical protein